MNSIWFTSDHHFGHKNIIEFEKTFRPFNNLEEMHECLIERWNKVVKPNDTVFHLGDFCFGKGYIKIAGKLNGKKRLIMGNHDSYPIEEYAPYFEKIYGAKYWERCILTHIPIREQNLRQRWYVNVHGHMHSRIIPDESYFNVSVELHDLTPVHADVIRDVIKKIDKGSSPK